MEKCLAIPHAQSQIQSTTKGRGRKRLARSRTHDTQPGRNPFPFWAL
jgi:hypothetical protein